MWLAYGTIGVFAAFALTTQDLSTERLFTVGAFGVFAVTGFWITATMADEFMRQQDAKPK